MPPALADILNTSPAFLGEFRKRLLAQGFSSEEAMTLLSAWLTAYIGLQSSALAAQVQELVAVIQASAVPLSGK